MGNRSYVVRPFPGLCLPSGASYLVHVSVRIQKSKGEKVAKSIVSQHKTPYVGTDLGMLWFVPFPAIIEMPSHRSFVISPMHAPSALNKQCSRSSERDVTSRPDEPQREL